MKRFLLCLAFLFAATPVTSFASFHEMKVVEVFAGSTLAPNAQYVVLQMYSNGQRFVSGHTVHVFNSSGVEVGTFQFMAAVGDGTTQARILIATPEAQALFGPVPDLAMTATITPAGGRVCFDTIDCVAWGTHAVTGATGNPESPRLGIPAGRALIRRLDVAGGPTTLENADDTGDSANDFIIGAPAPRNNAGTPGTIPPSTCPNNTVEGLEQCDNELTGTSNDGCSATCLLEVCGDGTPNNGEPCDDGDTSNTNACTNVCLAATCGDTFIQMGVETCDDGNMTNTDACVACANAACGDGFVRMGVENCDEGSLLNGTPAHCNAACTGLTGTVCGNNVPEVGEACDTGAASASCDADCTNVTCGDGTVNAAASETCDDGANNGMPNACNATCNGGTAAVCGNDIKEGSETCDDGDDNGDPNACNATCSGTTTPVCGNMVVEGGEGCDDGASNGTMDAHCDAACMPVEHDHGGGGGCAVGSTPRTLRVIGVLGLAFVLAIVSRRRRA